MGLHLGGLAGCLEGGSSIASTASTVKDSSAENVEIIFREINLDLGEEGADKQLNAGMLVGGDSASIDFKNVRASGQLEIENRTLSADRIIIGGIAGSASGEKLTADGAYANVDLTVSKCTVNSDNDRKGDSGYIGGIFGKGAGVKNCQFDGTVTLQDNRFPNTTSDNNGAGNFCVGGITGKAYSETRLENCVNTGDLTVEGNNYINTELASHDGDWYINAGGIVGSTEDSINILSSYSTGKISGENGDDANDHKGGIAGNVYTQNKATVTANNGDVFYLNTSKAFGAKDGGKIDAVPLAQIVHQQEGETSAEIGRVQQGDSSTFIQKGDQTVFEKLCKADKLGAGFSVKLPDISQYTSSNTDAAVVMTGDASQAQIQTVKGGTTVITAPVSINQNRLENGTFSGNITPITSTVQLSLTVVNVQLDNTSHASAIHNITPYQLTAGLQAYGTTLNQYDYTWEYSNSPQTTEPTGAGADMEGLTQGPASLDAPRADVTWKKEGNFDKDKDPGWYRLRATPTTDNQDQFSFYSQWHYLTVDDFMVISTKDTPATLELSSQDTDIGTQGTLKAEVTINPTFKGEIEYQWYHDGKAVSNANIKKTIAAGAAEAEHTFTETYSIGSAYNENQRGAYELRIVKVLPEEAGEGYDASRDIRGATTTVKCYDASAAGTYTQSGPRYEGLTAVMEQSGITLSEDMKTGSYNAYFIKDDSIVDASALDNAIRAELNKDTTGDTYTAKADFTMKSDSGTTADVPYRLIIYPLGTERLAVPSDNTSPDMQMQFKVASDCLLDQYAITAVDYPLKGSYSVADLKSNTPLAESTPVVTGYNTADGKLQYSKTAGADEFAIDADTGEIICNAVDTQTIRNGRYTLTVKVQDVAYKTESGAILSVPGTNYTKTLTFDITGSDNFNLVNDLYIFDGGYAYTQSGDPAPTEKQTQYRGIYQIVAPTSETAEGKIIVVNGTHIEGGRISLTTDITTNGVPITVNNGATAEVDVPDGQNVTLTNSAKGGASLQSDGSLRLTGGTTGTGVLNLPGSAAGSGSLTIGAANTKGLTVNAQADLATDSATIESGQVNVTGSITGKATIKGGNVKATAIGTAGTTIDGGSIIGSVIGEVKNSEQERVYPVTLKLSENPTDYAGLPASVTTQKTKADGKADGTAKTWNAQASGDSFNQTGGQTGELYVYLPQYSGGPYTAVTATAAPASGTAQTLSRKINADADGSLSASLLTATYSLSLPKTLSIGSAKVGQGATAPIAVGVASNDGWLYEGRTIDLEISPGDGYKTIWGKYQMQPADTTAQGSYSPEFWIQTPSGAALSKAGGFATLTYQDRAQGKTGQLVVPADSKITEGTYKSQLNWKIIPNDPVVGGTN